MTRGVPDHVYVEGRTINVCLWCGKSPEAPHIEEITLVEGIEFDWDVSEGQP